MVVKVITVNNIHVHTMKVVAALVRGGGGRVLGSGHCHTLAALPIE
jgi:hypothetical protein